VIEGAPLALGAINSAIEATQSTRGRVHLGASLIAHKCSRHLWYVFRHAVSVRHDGRLLRLFNVGHDFEPQMNRWLRDAGVTVWDVDDRTDQQFRIEDVSGHFGGSLDGVLRGLPDAPQDVHVSEQKTHNDKSFKDVSNKGVKESKPQHYGQMQVYMHKTGIQWALYQAINKNTSELYLERIAYDQVEAERLLRVADNIICSDRPLEKIGGPSWFECKFCDHSGVCHSDDVPNVSCRTCVSATPCLDGDARWTCEKHDRDLSPEDQRIACDDHQYIPDLLENWAKFLHVVDGVLIYENTTNGKEFGNGTTGEAYTSQEIFASTVREHIGADEIDELRSTFNGRLAWG